MTEEPRLVDARLFENADHDLAVIAAQSLRMSKCAEKLSKGEPRDKGEPKAVVPVSAGTKSNPYIVVSAECGSLDVDSFANWTAVVKSHWSERIENVRVEVSHRRLLQERLVYIDECVDVDASEYASANDFRYAATARDFHSFEARGRVVAYQVTYQIVRTRNGKIIQRFSQPLSYYYVDEVGDGTFELYKGNTFTNNHKGFGMTLGGGCRRAAQ